MYADEAEAVKPAGELGQATEAAVRSPPKESQEDGVGNPKPAEKSYCGVCRVEGLGVYTEVEKGGFGV